MEYLCTKRTRIVFTQLQNEIDLDFGMEELENFSWVRSDENMNVSVKEEDPNVQQLHHTYRDITCSASSSLGSYSGLFGKSSDMTAPNLEIGSIPGTSADPNLQYSNLSFLNDPKLEQLAEWNLLGSPADYYVSQILEASYRPQFGGNWSSSETLPYPVAVFDDPLFSRVKQRYFFLIVYLLRDSVYCRTCVFLTVSEHIRYAAAKLRRKHRGVDPRTGLVLSSHECGRR